MRKVRLQKMYSLQVNSSGVICDITLDTEYKKVYVYKFIKKYGAYVIQRNVKLATLRSGLKRGTHILT